MIRSFAAPFLASVFLVVGLARIASAQGGVPNFATQPTALAGATTDVQLADMDHDGRLDLLVTVAPNIEVMKGNGVGQFQPAATIAALGGYRLRVADFNGDGHPDVGFVRTGTSSVTVFLGNGNMGFPTNYFAASQTLLNSIEVADLNHDGFVDAVAGGGTNSTGIIRFLATGANGFTQMPLPTGNNPSYVAIGDLNADSHPDLATIVNGSVSLGIFLGDGQGLFAPLATYPTDPSPHFVALQDVNGDGTLDALIGGFLKAVTIHLGNGAGGFGPKQTIAVPASPMTFGIADMNGDGHADLVIAGTITPIESIVFGDGAGGFGSPLILNGATGLEWAVATGDLNFDGKEDFISNLDNPPAFFVHMNVQAPPASIQPFGLGTAGCSGIHGISTSATPKVGESKFGFRTTNAPPYGRGLGIVANVADLPGNFGFGGGVLLHLDLLASTRVFMFEIESDAGGTAFGPLPIPNNPVYGGLKFHAQTLWIWGETASCDPSFFDVSSSRGLTFTILP